MQKQDQEVFEYRNKRLIIRPESIRYEFGPTVYIVENPVAIMCWTEAIELDMFRIGSKIKLRLKGENGNKFTFVLRSYFGVGWSRIVEVSDEILNSLWGNFFGDIQEYYGEKIDNGETIVLSGFQINESKLSKLGNRDESVTTIDFKDASLKETYDQLIVSSISNPEKFIAIKDRWDWNAPLIQTIIKRLCPLSS